MSVSGWYFKSDNETHVITEPEPLSYLSRVSPSWDVRPLFSNSLLVTSSSESLDPCIKPKSVDWDPAIW